MISYREKQLLASMKFLQDSTNELSEELKTAVIATQKGELYQINPAPQPNVETFEELTQLASDARYDCYIRAKDILTPEELADLERRKGEIEHQFRSQTKLHPADYGFLMAAIAMQIIRQAIQPSLDFKNLNPDKREDHKSAAEATDKSTAEKKSNEALNDAKKRGIDPQSGKSLYYAPLSEIADIKKGVPYDETAIKGLGGGKLHRFKTLGHDPVLGYLFGTCNILTNTLTKNNMQTIHILRVGKSLDTKLAKTKDMFIHSKERYCEKGGRLVVAAAVAKQVYHIKSDQKSTEGIGLPFLQLICDENTIRDLCQQGIDYNALEFLGTIAKQSAYSELINFIIAISHRILIAKEEYDKFCKENQISDEVTLKAVLKQKSLHDYLWGDRKLSEVRTRKILLVSNAVASCANVVYVGIAGGVSAYNGNAEGLYQALGKLDIGGILVTLRHLLSDSLIITKIKDDFIKSEISKDFQKRLAEVQESVL